MIHTKIKPLALAVVSLNINLADIVSLLLHFLACFVFVACKRMTSKLVLRLIKICFPVQVKLIRHRKNPNVSEIHADRLAYFPESSGANYISCISCYTCKKGTGTQSSGVQRDEVCILRKE